VFLKSLSLKGFKSFADPTTLEFEPGVTVVVGPNGSGKSNIVDAIAWVLGAQGPSTVRSSKMDDVIFVGTDKRPPLGRAEVTLTIDNTARRLPVDLNEVAITRTLFRTGESEYAINGAECRLLDIQELLSDSGVGRQQHVVVGQGQLDSVLQARPEERRAVIEEAAGILKYRRRRERAERRLEASEAGLARVQDLLREVSRQIRPLERQARAAQRHNEIRAELEALGLHLRGREITELAGRLHALDAQSHEIESRIAERSSALVEADRAVSSIEDELGVASADELAPVVARLEQLRERTRGYLALVRERRRSAAAIAAALEGSEGAAEELERVDRELASIGTEVATVESDLNVVVADHEAALAAASEVARRHEQAVRDAERAATLQKRAEDLRSRLGALRDEAARLDADHARADAEREAREREEVDAERALADAEANRRAAEEHSSRDAARVEALELALDEARARAGLERLADVDGVVGTLFDIVEVDEDVAAAFEAALESALDAVIVKDVAAARGAIVRLREQRSGGKLLPLGGLEPGAGAVGSLRQQVRSADPAVGALLDRLIGEVELVRGGFSDAIDRALSEPGRTFVTLEGDRFSPSGWRVGTGRAGTTRAALDAAKASAESSSSDAAAAVSAATDARQTLAAARVAANAARRAADRLSGERDGSARAIADAESELAQLSGAASAQPQAPGSEEGLGDLGALGERRRSLEVQVAALRERMTLLAERRRSLEHRQSERRQVSDVEPLAAEDDASLERLAARLADLDRGLERGITAAASERDRRAEASRERLDRLSQARRKREELDRQLNADRERHQRVEIERAEARIRHESAIDQLHRDFGVTVEEALAAPPPELPEGVDATSRGRALEAELDSLGPVNPLAAEELAALADRKVFLDGQLEDVRSARRELNRVIAAIDREIVSVFAAAFADVERNFADLVATLFPGGSGRLQLSEPEDLLSTGVELEASPAGRRVRRLTLLSGGERSLVALAFLFAVFRSRPSPFYVLDEVEAALDDVNIGRFLALVDEFRDEAQLLIVSHQKKTMEIADALYGISMQPGGASKVVSERVTRTNAPSRVPEAREVVSVDAS
jgi:chromosome segregation protein